MLYLDWMQAVLESNSRCAWKWRSSELRDAPGGLDWASFEMNLGGHDRASMAAVIKRASRPWLSKLGDALRGHDRANLEAVIERVWRCTWEAMIVWTWRPWSCKFEDALGGCDRAGLDDYLEAFDWQCARCWDSVHQLVSSHPWECDKVTLPLSSHGELADGSRSCREARWMLKLHPAVNL